MGWQFLSNCDGGSVMIWQRLQPTNHKLYDRQANLQHSLDLAATVNYNKTPQCVCKSFRNLKLLKQCNHQSHSFIEIFLLFAGSYFSVSIKAIIKDEMPKVDNNVQWPDCQ